MGGNFSKTDICGKARKNLFTNNLQVIAGLVRIEKTKTFYSIFKDLNIDQLKTLEELN